MTQDEDNITTMMEATNDAMDADKTLWVGIPAFVDVVTRVVTGVAAIREKQGQQARTGDTEQKEAARTAVEDQGLIIANQLAAYASKTGDHMLATRVATDKSKLDRMPVSDLLIFAKAVAKDAGTNQTVLASDYEITATDLTTFDAAILKLDELKVAPRDAVVNRKVATMSIPEAIQYVRGIYRGELDKMMTRFRRTQPDFYKAYTGARIIVDRTGTHKAETAKTTPAGGTP